MAKFLIVPTITDEEPITARLGASNAKLADADKGKFVKLTAESEFDLCAAGDDLEGYVLSVNAAPQDGFAIGSIARDGNFSVTLDGAQATPGTGNIAVGDYVVCGTVVARGTKLTAPPKVCKATDQTAAKASPYACRVLSIGGATTGTPGTVAVVEYQG